MPICLVTYVKCVNPPCALAELALGPAVWVGVVETAWLPHELCALAYGERICCVVKAAWPGCGGVGEGDCMGEAEPLAALVATARTCAAEIKQQCMHRQCVRLGAH